VKHTSGRPARVLLLLALLLLALPSTAHAYLDPGTGSYIVQLLIGTVLGGLFAVGMFWRRVVASIKRFFKRGSKDVGSRH
jgi:hypothetical protein